VSGEVKAEEHDESRNKPTDHDDDDSEPLQLAFAQSCCPPFGLTNPIQVPDGPRIDPHVPPQFASVQKKAVRLAQSLPVSLMAVPVELIPVDDDDDIKDGTRSQY